MKKKLMLAGFALALGAGYTLTAFSQVKPEIMVKQRQAAMTLQGKYFGPMAGMAAGKVPYNADTVAFNSSMLDALSRMPWDGFAESTKDVSAKTAALPAIWSEPAKFKGAQDNFQKAVQSLVAVSRGGDEAGQKAAIGAVGKACGACHQDFREKQN
jgi:cytochrome c556